MMNIRLARSENMEEIESILKDPEIFARIAEDDIEPWEYEIPIDGNQCYMMIYVDDKPIGVWNLYPVGSSTLNIHCNILKEHRIHAMEAGRLIVHWFAHNAPKQYVKLSAEIPQIYPDVYYFTKKFGFKDEGINRCSIKKAGKLVDQWRLGLTRDEARDFLGEINVKD